MYFVTPTLEICPYVLLSFPSLTCLRLPQSLAVPKPQDTLQRLSQGDLSVGLHPYWTILVLTSRPGKPVVEPIARHEARGP